MSVSEIPSVQFSDHESDNTVPSVQFSDRESDNTVPSAVMGKVDRTVPILFCERLFYRTLRAFRFT